MSPQPLKVLMSWLRYTPFPNSFFSLPSMLAILLVLDHLIDIASAFKGSWLVGVILIRSLMRGTSLVVITSVLIEPTIFGIVLASVT